MTYYEKGSETTMVTEQDILEALEIAMGITGSKGKVLAVPPDITRVHSFAGTVIRQADNFLGARLTDILPALGTHTAMTKQELDNMYAGVSKTKFRVHNWRTDVVTLGEVPGSYVSEVSEGRVDYPWPAQVNRLLVEGGHDMILSVGQVVPHEVVGMANYNKNIFVGTGGPEGINKSHFLGAVYGMERIMGRTDTPVRKVLNHASRNFAGDMPVIYFLTVVGKDEEGRLRLRGLFVGDDQDCFDKASRLSLRINFTMLDEPLKKVVVYLDPSEFRSTWLGNKSIYRTRMAIADGGELIVLAPGVAHFGEDRIMDGLIRKYGYRNSKQILELTMANDDLKANLGAAAHLIHGSPEGRFNITYCTKSLTPGEIAGVGFRHAPLDKMLSKYDPGKLIEGMNRTEEGEEVYFIPNPALGLWAEKNRY